MWRAESLENTLIWCWESLKAGGEGDDRGWDGWMASPIWWTWFWANSGSWWWTGKPGVLQCMGSPRVRHNWAIELNWPDPLSPSMRDKESIQFQPLQSSAPPKMWEGRTEHLWSSQFRHRLIEWLMPYHRVCFPIPYQHIIKGLFLGVPFTQYIMSGFQQKIISKLKGKNHSLKRQHKCRNQIQNVNLKQLWLLH